jgi:hypothetical protein
MKLFCLLGFHKIDNTTKIKSFKNKHILVLSEDDKYISSEILRCIEIYSGRCKNCNKSIKETLNNEDIHIGI